MEELTVTTTCKQSPAAIKAQLTNKGGVTIWFHFKDIKQDRHEFECTPDEWDRLVAWVEWQRKDKAISKEES